MFTCIFCKKLKGITRPWAWEEKKLFWQIICIWHKFSIYFILIAFYYLATKLLEFHIQNNWWTISVNYIVFEKKHKYYSLILNFHLSMYMLSLYIYLIFEIHNQKHQLVLPVFDSLFPLQCQHPWIMKLFWTQLWGLDSPTDNCEMYSPSDWMLTFASKAYEWLTSLILFICNQLSL